MAWEDYTLTSRMEEDDEGGDLDEDWEIGWMSDPTTSHSRSEGGDSSEDEGGTTLESQDVTPEELPNSQTSVLPVMLYPPASVPSLSQLGITTSEELIKRLKSRQEEGAPDGSSKLAVAQAAFQEKSMQIPEKEMLLADWVLDVLSRDARKAVKKESLMAGYWQLLINCRAAALDRSDEVTLANRYPLPDLLLGYSFLFPNGGHQGGEMLKLFHLLARARTSKQVFSIDNLNECLKAWVSKQLLPDSEVRDKQLPAQFLDLAVGLWSEEISKGSNLKKANHFFLQDLLPVYSEALWKNCHNKGASQAGGSSSVENTSAPLRAHLYKIPYDCLYSPDQIVENQETVMERAIASASPFSLLFLSVFVTQLALHRKDRQGPGTSKILEGAAFIEENEWRKGVLESFIVPAVDIITSSSREVNLEEETAQGTRIHVESLEALLDAVNSQGLSYWDEDNKWSVLLTDIVHNVLHQQRRIAAVKTEWKDATQSACQRILFKLHAMDEFIMGDHLRTGVMLSAFEEDSAKVGLLDALCSTSIKARDVDAFVNSTLEVLEQVVRESRRSKLKGVDVLSSKAIMKSKLLSRVYWKRSLGVAVGTFLSPDQSIGLLNSMLARLQGRFSDIHDYTTTRKRKRGPESVEEASMALIPLAIVDVYFASQLLLHLAIPEPISVAARQAIEALQSCAVANCLAWSLLREGDSQADGLTAALLVLLETLQGLCLRCGYEGGENGDAWTTLAVSLDKDMDVYHDQMLSILSGAGGHSMEVRVQVQLSFVKRLERDVLRGTHSPFTQFCSQDENEGNFGLLTDGSVMALPTLDPAIPLQPHPTQWLHALHDDEDFILYLWDEVLSQHLPVLDHLASSKLLSRMARQALFLAQCTSHLEARFPSARASLTTCARNLELVRWRDALCEVMKEAIGRPKARAIDLISCADVMAAFPIEWFDASFLAEVWPKVFFRVDKPARLHRKVNRNKRRRRLRTFLADCLEKRFESGRFSPKLADKNILDLVLDYASKTGSDKDDVSLRLIRACVTHGLGDSLASRVTQLERLFVQVRAKEAKELQAIQPKDKCIRRLVYILEAAIVLVEQMDELLRRGGAEHGELRKSVAATVREHVTRNQAHLDLMDPSKSTSRVSEMEVDQRSLGKDDKFHILQSFRLHKAALRLLYSHAGEGVEEEKEQAYQTFLDTISQMLVERIDCHQSNTRSQGGALAVIRGLEQAYEAQIDVRNVSLPQVEGAGFPVSVFGQPDGCFNWPSLFACVLSLSSFGPKIKHYQHLDSSLARVCRRASVAEYEGTLKAIFWTLNHLIGPDPEEEEEVPRSSGPLTPDLTHADHVLKTLTVVLCNSPDGALAVSQKAVSRMMPSLNRLIRGDKVVMDHAKARPEKEIGEYLGCIETIVQVMHTLVDAKPIYFRRSDVSDLLCLLADIFTKRCQTGSVPSNWDKTGQWRKKIYSLIVTTLTDVVRHRRDLVATFLPQLTMIVNQHVDYFQVRVSTTCFEDTGKGVDEARLFTRLLSVLTSKAAAPASKSGGNDPRSKVKSLSKPFSSHAPSVIVFYTRCIARLPNGEDSETQTTLLANGETREELTRAMYNLCDVVGPWQKNVMMDVLADEADKIVFRNLWRGWEKQRYRGA